MQRVLVGVACATAVFFSASAYALDGWHLESATPVEAKSAGFDYIAFDQSTNRVFLGHRKDGLQVFDPTAQKVVGVIEGTKEHGGNSAVPIPEFDLGLSNNQDGTITPFKLSTLEAREPINVGHRIDTSHYDAASKRVVVNVEADNDGTDLVVIDVPSLRIAGTIKVPTKRAEHAQADGKGNFYLVSRDPAKVYRLNIKDMKITHEWPLSGCAQPTGLAVDTSNNRIFLGCRTSGDVKAVLAVMNADTGAIIYTGAIGNGNDGVIYDAQSKRIFASNSSAPNINVFEQVDADTYKPLEALETHPPVKVIAYDPKNKKLYSMGMEVADPSTFAVLKFSTGK
jgi:DNA-binding beta-propeller fold protein YncE